MPLSLMIKGRPVDLLERLVAEARRRGPMPVAVCWPCNRVSLEGALEAAEAGLIVPYFVGPEAVMRSLASSGGLDLKAYEIVEASSEEESVMTAARLWRAGTVKALMKGSLHSDTLLRGLLQEECGLRGAGHASHVFVMEAPLYPRPLLITDAVVNIYPALQDKVEILRNAIALAQVLGIAEPRVAILAAVETVNPKMTSTVDAAALCKMAERGQIRGAVLDGPLAFDTAISEDAARLKGLSSAVAGKADILLTPDLEAGNMLAKQLEYLGGAHLAGIVVGMKAPVILTSRADSAQARMASCAVASAMVHAAAGSLRRREDIGNNEIA